MCLEKITPTNKAPITVGYQVKGIDLAGAPYSRMAGNPRPQPIGEWLDAADYGNSQSIHCDDFISIYQAGFHVFHRKKDALEWTSMPLGKCSVPNYHLFKVACRDRVAHGTQRVAASEAYIKAEISIFSSIKILREVTK